MTRLRLIAAAVAALGLAACGQKKSPDYAGGTPDVAGLTLETSGGTADGLAAPSTSGGAVAMSVDMAAATATTCTYDYEFTCHIRQSVAGVNAFVRASIEPVQVLVAADQHTDPSDDVRVYGPTPLPATSPVANFKLTVQFLGNDTFRWKLDAQAITPAGSPFLTVMAGQLHRGDLPHRGRGFIGIDLDQLHAVNPAVFLGQGKLLAAFAHAGIAKALVFGTQNFAPNATAKPVSAVFVGWKDIFGDARVRLAAWSEFVPPPAGLTDAGNELLLSRAGYWPLVGGRTVVAVLGGDVSAYSYTGFNVQAFVGFECFDGAMNVTYRAEFYCGQNTSGPAPVSECHPETSFNTSAAAVGLDTTSGLPLAGKCAPNTDLYDSSTGVGTDPSSTAQEGAAPATPDAPPTSMPSF